MVENETHFTVLFWGKPENHGIRPDRSPTARRAGSAGDAM
jgi:hypothetical protein